MSTPRASGLGRVNDFSPPQEVVPQGNARSFWGLSGPNPNGQSQSISELVTDPGITAGPKRMQADLAALGPKKVSLF